MPTAPVRLKTHTRTFNTRDEFARSGGRIWSRARLMPKNVFLPKDLRTWTSSLITEEAGNTEDLDGNAHRTIGVDMVWVVR